MIFVIKTKKEVTKNQIRKELKPFFPDLKFDKECVSGCFWVKTNDPEFLNKVQDLKFVTCVSFSIMSEKEFESGRR